MGSNKRYAEAIDRRMDQKIQNLADRPPVPPAVVRQWRPPWPPIRFGEDEWFLMRDSNREPAAIIRKLRMGPRSETYYRVVTWALQSADRNLVGYFATLEEADRSVLFVPDNPQVPGASRGPNGL
ncbi:hypothetical protein QMG83_15375 [Salinibacterium sp. G-O1]|uniref:hypothetical protein n=1 Tax=Salinibacterium sp. G-O1 TaxID=3046208 RepID=UPI0024BAB17F|nr:hypothetical protein [Salinibacterium sp. G-O1]MDJ0336609.1 hypothetical protein [Salinibacterium sp. G-O1]